MSFISKNFTIGVSPIVINLYFYAKVTWNKLLLSNKAAGCTFTLIYVILTFLLCIVIFNVQKNIILSFIHSNSFKLLELSLITILRHNM